MAAGDAEAALAGARLAALAEITHRDGVDIGHIDVRGPLLEQPVC